MKEKIKDSILSDIIFLELGNFQDGTLSSPPLPSIILLSKRERGLGVRFLR